MISQTLDKMLLKMELSADEDQAVAASCLRIDVNRWAQNHACYRCEKAVWIAGSGTPVAAKIGQSPAKKVFNWGVSLGACGAFLPLTFQPNSDDDHFPKAPFFCSAESKNEGAGNAFASGAGERQGPGAGLTEGEFPLRQMPRARGE